MARRRTPAGMDSSEDLTRKVEILERELEVQRVAIEKLKDMGKGRHSVPESVTPAVRKSA